MVKLTKNIIERLKEINSEQLHLVLEVIEEVYEDGYKQGDRDCYDNLMGDRN